jgi:hypothetical protein
VKESPILVTGAHRSGTTWVGRTLAKAPGVAYIHEPFNIKHRPGICNAPVNKWYTYVSEENSQQFYLPVKATLEFRYAIRAEISAVRTLRDVGRMTRDMIKTTYLHYIVQPRPLVKDPFALFSAKWFADRFNAEIVILVRHPAAFVSSILKKGWDFPFEHWLNQEALLRDHLDPFAFEIEEYANTSPPLMDQAILLWRATYYVVHKYQVEQPLWFVHRYEDISLEPLDSFFDIYDGLGLELTPRVKTFIRQTTNANNPTDAEDASVFNVRRDSKAIIKVWQTRLNPGQIRYIRETTEDISHWFYSSADWE